MEHPLLMAFVSEMRCKGMNYLRICQIFFALFMGRSAFFVLAAWQLLQNSVMLSAKKSRRCAVGMHTSCLMER